MRVGVTFPQTEISADPGAAKAFAQAAEDLGYSHILALEHVLGVDRRKHPEWTELATRDQPLDVHSMFHEPFVLFGYLAGLTSRIGFATRFEAAGTASMAWASCHRNSISTRFDISRMSCYLPTSAPNSSPRLWRHSPLYIMVRRFGCYSSCSL